MPADSIKRGSGPGFQGSETSSAELTVYHNGGDIILKNSTPGQTNFIGRGISDTEPSLIALSTNKSLNGGGQWTAIVKDGTPLGRDLDLRDTIVDDDWVDISFKRHNRATHTMRGLIDDIRRERTVSGTGATSTTYTITGRDFGSIWERTPIWFNKFIDPGDPQENLIGEAGMRVFGALSGLTTVDKTVEAFLFGFLRELKNFGRANWKVPGNMPGVLPETGFTENVHFEHRTEPFKFKNDPPRLAINPNFMDPNGANAWAMAQEWSDPAFCELWYDLVPINPSFGEDPILGKFQRFFPNLIERREVPILADRPVEQTTPGETTMALILRDRPFPTARQGTKSPWFSLPIVEINREDIISDDVGRGGIERFNAFFISSQIVQEFLKNASIEITAPLWDKEDMLIHGFRRFDIMSRYKADLTQIAAEDTALLTLTINQRRNVRDWYAINPYLYDGTIALAFGRPDAKVGMRLRIPASSEDRTETYYIENVSHSWRLGPGLKTTFGVTRGWIGTDATYVKAIRDLKLRYFSSQTLAAELDL